MPKHEPFELWRTLSRTGHMRDKTSKKMREHAEKMGATNDSYKSIDHDKKAREIDELQLVGNMLKRQKLDSSSSSSGDVDFVRLCEDIVQKIEGVVRRGNVLNGRQCKILAAKLSVKIVCVREVVESCGKYKPAFAPLLAALHRCYKKADILVEQCGEEDWCAAAVFQLGNMATFTNIVCNINSVGINILECAKKYSGVTSTMQCAFPLNVAESCGGDHEDEEELRTRLEALANEGWYSTSSYSRLFFSDPDPDFSMKRQYLARFLLKKINHNHNSQSRFNRGIKTNAFESILWEEKNMPMGTWGEYKFFGVSHGNQVTETSWLGVPCAKKEFFMKRPATMLMEEAMTRLKHPCIVDYICCGKEEGTGEDFIAMELMEKSLYELIDSREGINFSLEVALDIIRQIVEGVKFLHENSFAHCDLEPSNVLVRTLRSPYHEDYYCVKLMDLDGPMRKKKVERSLCIAPELQPFAQLEEVEWFKVDAYSFAMTCAHILTLEAPFKDFKGSLSEFYSEIMNGLRPILPRVSPKELVDLVEECWSTNRSQRPEFSIIYKKLENIIFNNMQVPFFGLENPTVAKGRMKAVKVEECGEAFKSSFLASNAARADGGIAVRDETVTTLESKHKVFLSHSGAQKDFVEQLCVDLERCDRYPFFDWRRSSLPIGENFRKLIFEGVEQCEVGVVVFSEEFFTRSKWPMLELVAMTRNPKLVIIPVYLNISLKEVHDVKKREMWLSVWRGWAEEDERLDIEEWCGVFKRLRSLNSLVYNGGGEVGFREAIVEAVCEIVLPETRWRDSHIQGLCKVSGLQDLIGDNLVIDLSRDLLSVSPSGYVIRTSLSDEGRESQPCVLKRCDIVDQNPPDLARLQHPHVVHLIGFWIEEKYLFLVMEVLDGDLDKLISRTKSATPLSLHVAVDLMLQIAEGMLYLHEMGVSYSLKCDNVLFKLTDRNKTEAFRPGDVVVKLGGFGCSRPTQLGSKSQDALYFGLTCLEILTGDKRSDKGTRSSIPETTPFILKDLIVRCLNMGPTFAEIVLELSQAKSYILQTYSDDFMVSSQSMETVIVQTETDCGREEIFAVHQLHPQLGDIPTSLRAVRGTLIFFHGFRKVPDEWRRTWMTRDNKLIWPQKWLPEDLGAENIRVLSVSLDENSTVSNICNRHEIGENLVKFLVFSPEWKLGESGEAIFLIGHSFGGVLIKYLVTKARHFIQNNVGKQEAWKCEKFLEGLAKIVFYSVPHASTGQEFETYVSKCRKLTPLKKSSFLQSLEGDTHFVADMNKLSADFESALPEKVQILAFLEGKPMSKDCVLVTEKSCEGAAHSWEWHKIDKDNHFEVCRPNSKNHTGYRVLLEHVHQRLNEPFKIYSNAKNLPAQNVGLIEAAKSLSFWEGGSSGSAIVSAIPEHATLPMIDSNIPCDRSRDNEDVDCKEGGIRFRSNLGMFVVEYRPPRFKWKMWMGTYASVDEARRACDCARFYAGQGKGRFYFKDSPALFAEQGPLNRPFSLVSRDVKDKAFNVEVKRRAKLVIRKVKDSQTVDRNVESTSSQQLEPSHSDRKESLHSIDSQISPLEMECDPKEILVVHQLESGPSKKSLHQRMYDFFLPS